MDYADSETPESIFYFTFAQDRYVLLLGILFFLGITIYIVFSYICLVGYILGNKFIKTVLLQYTYCTLYRGSRFLLIKIML